MGGLMSLPDRVTKNEPGGLIGRALGGDDARALAKLYIGAVVIASLFIIAAVTVGLAWRLLALAAGFGQ